METSMQHLDVTSFASAMNKVGTGINKRKAGNISMKPTRQRQKLTDPFRITVKDTTLARGQSLKTPEKFKLQLFPIDDNTRRILVELNHYPYLELTMRPQKKISSVVKHLNVKWVISRKMSGELMLFPYEAQTENIVDHRKWTLKDTGTSAADVFMAVGHPEIFRLRYGWFPDVETETFQMSTSHFSSENNLQSEEHEDANKEKQPSSLVSQVGSVSAVDTINSSSYKLRPSDESVKVVQNLGVGNSTLLSWVDCVTSISVGQLLSETPDANLLNPLPSERNPSFKQIPVNCDSFDVAIADLIARNQGSQSSAQVLHSSIWEAEETRHAFPNQEASSSRNGVVSVSSYRSLIQDHASGEQVANLKSDSRDHSGQVHANSHPDPQVLHNDMSNLGLSNLCWGDSLGPFEFGISSKQNNGGDTISLSGLFGNSLDAFQNSSALGVEKFPSS